MLNVSHNLANELSSDPLDMPSLLDFMPAPQQDSKQFSHFWSNFSMADVGFFVNESTIYGRVISLSLDRTQTVVFFAPLHARPLGIVQNTVKHPVTLRYKVRSPESGKRICHQSPLSELRFNSRCALVKQHNREKTRSCLYWKSKQISNKFWNINIVL